MSRSRETVRIVQRTILRVVYRGEGGDGGWIAVEKGTTLYSAVIVIVAVGIGVR